MTRAVGLEWSDVCLRMVELEQSARGVRLVRCDEWPVPASAEGSSPALKQLLSRARWARDRAAVSIDSGAAMIRELSLPFTDTDQIRKVIKFELEGHIQNHTAEDLIVDFIQTGTSDKNALLLAVAVPKTHLRETLGQLEPAGIDPVAVDLDITALINALIQSGDLDSGEPCLLIHGNGRYTKLALIKDKKPVDLRTLRFTLTPPAPDFGMPETLVIVDQPVILPPPANRTDQTAMANILSKEISRFLLSTATEVAPTTALVSGEYDTPEAAELLPSLTGLSVRRPKYGALIGPGTATPDPPWNPYMGVALGLAWKAMDRDALGMDFRKEEFVYQKRFDLIKTAALTTLVLINIFLGLFVWDRIEKKREAEQVFQGVLEHQKKMLTTVFSGVDVSDPEQAFNKFQELYHLELRKAGAAGGTQQKSALHIWNDLAKAMNGYYQRALAKGPDASSFVVVEQMDLMRQSAEMIRISGQTASATDAEELKNVIKAVPLFEEVQLKSIDRSGERFKFTIEISMKKEPRREK